MEKIPNKFMSVEYQLYTIVDGHKTLQEETGSERPFEFITGFGIALDAFEQEVILHAKGDSFDFQLEPEQAFGAYEPQGVHKIDRQVFSIRNSKVLRLRKIRRLLQIPFGKQITAVDLAALHVDVSF